MTISYNTVIKNKKLGEFLDRGVEKNEKEDDETL